MDNLTTIVRDEISRQYRSVRQFAFAVGVPLSTINSALHNGVGGSSFDTVMQICKTLGIKAMADDAAFYLTDDTEQLLTQYAKLVGLFFPPPLCGGVFRFFIANTAMLRYNIYDRFVDELYHIRC